MIEVIILGTIAGVLFPIAVISLIMLLYKRNRKYFFVALASLALFTVCASWMIYLIADKSHRKLHSLFTMRSGDVIYQALYGKGQDSCVRILDYQDVVVPVIDATIRLRVETCPKEIERVVQHYPFVYEERPANALPYALSTEDRAWLTSNAEDKILVYTHLNERYTYPMYLFVSMDSLRSITIEPIY